MNIAIKDTTLEDIVRRVDAGEHVVLTRDGKPFATVEPAASSQSERPRLLGAMKGETWIATNFDDLGPEWDDYVK
jgi:antitoxin (DNA-binding transcriptional repressor) of toxin-antitoxin stability system